jgi:hypothetical protein
MFFVFIAPFRTLLKTGHRLAGWVASIAGQDRVQNAS